MNRPIANDKKERTKGLRVYRLPGIEKTIVARKGGPSYDQVKNSDAYAQLRKNQQEFALASKVSKMVRESLPENYHHLCDAYISARLTALFRKVFQVNNGAVGKRPFNLSANKDILSGFSFSGGKAFDEIFHTKFFFKKGTYRGHGIIHFPALVPLESLAYPGNATHFRIVSHSVTISDYAFDDSKQSYVCLAPEQHGRYYNFQTDLKPLVKIPLDPLTEQIALKPEEGEWSKDLSILTMFGIQYFTFKNSHYQLVPRSGVLSVWRVQ